MKIQHALTAAALIAMSGLVQAQVDPLQARSWAASCAACHGTNGNAQSGMATLAGIPKEVTIKKMLDYKEGRMAGATIMHQLAKGYSDEQIAAIAGYFAAQNK